MQKRFLIFFRYSNIAGEYQFDTTSLIWDVSESGLPTPLTLREIEEYISNSGLWGRKGFPIKVMSLTELEDKWVK